MLTNGICTNHESLLENGTHDPFGEFGIQIVPPIRVRKPWQVSINKKKSTCEQVDISVSLNEKKKWYDRQISAHFVQWWPDEPGWTWTQIWIQARMPDYSFNWTARSSAIQSWQRCQCCSSPTWRWPSWSLGLLASSLPLNIDRPVRMLDCPLKSLCAKDSGWSGSFVGEEISPWVNRIRIYKGGRIDYRVDRSP